MGSKLCFKPRARGQSVQLVRYVYCSELKRSKTISLGSLRRDADPECLAQALKLNDGIVLDDAAMAEITAWLVAHGDPVAASTRAAQKAAWAQEVRDEIATEMALLPVDHFAVVHSALGQLIDALPQIYKDRMGFGDQAHAELKKQYLSVTKQCDLLTKAAQKLRLARAKRQPEEAT